MEEVRPSKVYRNPPRSKDVIRYWEQRITDPHFQEELLLTLARNETAVGAAITIGGIIYVLQNPDLLFGPLGDILGILSPVEDIAKGAVDGAKQAAEVLTDKEAYSLSIPGVTTKNITKDRKWYNSKSYYEQFRISLFYATSQPKIYASLLNRGIIDPVEGFDLTVIEEITGYKLT